MIIEFLSIATEMSSYIFALIPGGKVRANTRRKADTAEVRDLTRIIIACDSRKMLNMRLYIVIFALLRGVYARTREIPREFLCRNCA